MTKTVRSLENLEEPFNFHYPSGATIVTSHARGRDNAMAVAWHVAISRDPAYYAICISPNRFTHSLISETGEFVVNFMPKERNDLVATVAGCSGRDVDKFRSFKIAASQGSRVKAQVLEDAFAAFECRVVGHHPYGDHDIFVGAVLAVQFEAAAFKQDGRLLDLERVKPILYMGNDRYTTTGDGSVHIEREALVKAAMKGTAGLRGPG